MEQTGIKPVRFSIILKSSVVSKEAAYILRISVDGTGPFFHREADAIKSTSITKKIAFWLLAPNDFVNLY